MFCPAKCTPFPLKRDVRSHPTSMKWYPAQTAPGKHHCSLSWNIFRQSCLAASSLPQSRFLELCARYVQWRRQFLSTSISLLGPTRAHEVQEQHRASSGTGSRLGWVKKLHINSLHHANVGLWPWLQFTLSQGEMSYDFLSRRKGPFILPAFIHFHTFTMPIACSVQNPHILPDSRTLFS